MKRILTGVFFAGVLIFTACSKHTGADIKPATYTIKYYEKKFGECDTNNFSNCVRVNFEYPVINFTEYPALKDSAENHVQSFLLSSVFEGKHASKYDDIADSIISDYKRLKRDFPDAPAGYALERTVTVLFNNSGVFGLEMKEYSYLGGAHPNGTTFYANLDAMNGTAYTLNDLFNDNYIETLTSAGEREFRKARELNENESLTKAGFWFENDKFFLNNNFLIMQNGLKFLFNNYEVGPYAMGNTEFVIPYAGLKSIIKKDGPLAVFIK